MTPQKRVVGYVLRKFPVLSETFVLNEILALESRGLNVHVFALAPSRDLGARQRAEGDVEAVALAVCRRREVHPERQAVGRVLGKRRRQGALHAAQWAAIYFDCVVAEAISTLTRRLREQRRPQELSPTRCDR